MAKILLFTQGVNGAYLFPLLDSATGLIMTSAPTGSVKAQVRSADKTSAPLLADLTCTIVEGTTQGSPAGYYAMIAWTDAESRVWDWDNGYMDIILRDALGNGLFKIWKGKVTLDRAVTDHG